MTTLAEFSFPARYPQYLGVMVRLPDAEAMRVDRCSFCSHPLVIPAYIAEPRHGERRGLIACLDCAESHARELEHQADIHKFLFGDTPQ